MRRAGGEDPRDSRLSHGELGTRHRAERAGIAGRLRQHRLYSGQRGRRVSQLELDPRLEHARRGHVTQCPSYQREGGPRGVRVAPGCGERSGPCRRLVSERALLGRRRAISLLRLETASGAIEHDAEIELHCGLRQRLRKRLELLHRLLRCEARRRHQRLGEEPLRPFALHRAHVHHHGDIEDRGLGQAELRPLRRLGGDLSQEDRHLLRALARHTKLPRLRVRAPQGLARLRVQGLGPIGQRRAV